MAITNKQAETKVPESGPPWVRRSFKFYLTVLVFLAATIYVLARDAREARISFSGKTDLVNFRLAKDFSISELRVSGLAVSGDDIAFSVRYDSDVEASGNPVTVKGSPVLISNFHLPQNTEVTLQTLDPGRFKLSIQPCPMWLYVQPTEVAEINVGKLTEKIRRRDTVTFHCKKAGMELRFSVQGEAQMRGIDISEFRFDETKPGVSDPKKATVDHLIEGELNLSRGGKELGSKLSFQPGQRFEAGGRDLTLSSLDLQPGKISLTVKGTANKIVGDRGDSLQPSALDLLKSDRYVQVIIVIFGLATTTLSLRKQK